MVVVNDLGGSSSGEGADASAAEMVAEEIVAAGGAAIANHDDVSDFEGAERMIRQAVDVFGDLHVLVNNAGILRDRMLVNMSPEEWDAIVKVHLRGHFAPTRHAAAYWREQSKSGNDAKRSVINTSSTSGLFGSRGPDQLRRRQDRDRDVLDHRRPWSWRGTACASTRSLRRPPPGSPKASRR